MQRLAGALVVPWRDQFLKRASFFFGTWGVPMKNAAILDCIRSEQPSGCRKLMKQTDAPPVLKFLAHFAFFLVCKAAAILQQEKAAVKIQVPPPEVTVLYTTNDADALIGRNVFFPRGPAERKV